MSLRAALGLADNTPDDDVVAHLEADPRHAALNLLGVPARPLNPIQQVTWLTHGRLVGPGGEPPLAVTLCHLNGTMFLYGDLEPMEQPDFPPRALPVSAFAMGPAPDDVDGGPPEVSWVHIQYGPGPNDACTVWVPDDLEMMVPQDGLVPLEQDEPDSVE
ncbi:MAG: hypothetical protein AB8H79_09485 [Myxococcota bacterium]